jgi:hypothetical protein
MTESTDRSQSRAICLRGRSLSLAQTVLDRQATQSSRRQRPNLWRPRKTNACRNMQQNSESDSHARFCAVHLLLRRDLGAAPIPRRHRARRRFAGNRCNDSRSEQTADSSIRTVSRRKRIHQSTPYFSQQAKLNYSNPCRKADPSAFIFTDKFAFLSRQVRRRFVHHSFLLPAP